MKRKNGFTLIELLAVIVILALIALISTPIIINVIEKAKKGAFEDSAYGIVEAGKQYYISVLSDKNAFTGEYFDFGYKKDVDALQIGGSVPKEGYMVVNDKGESRIVAGDGEGTWACKDYDEEKVRVQDSKCVFEVPEGTEKYILKITEGKINGENIQSFGFSVQSDLDDNTDTYIKNATIEAPASKDGKVFSYWECNGSIRGYEAILTIQISAKNYLCKPVYEATKRKAEPFINIDDYYPSKAVPEKLKFINYWRMNDSKYQKQSIVTIVAKSKEYATEEMMVMENEGKYEELMIKNNLNPSTSNWGIYLLRVDLNGNAGRKFWFRIGLTYKDTTTGEILTTYSPIEYVNYQ